MDEPRKTMSDLKNIQRQPRESLYSHGEMQREQNVEYTDEMQRGTSQENYGYAHRMDDEPIETITTQRRRFKRRAPVAPAQEPVYSDYESHEEVSYRESYHEPYAQQREVYQEEEYPDRREEQPKRKQQKQQKPKKKRKELNPHLRRFRFFIILAVVSLVACYASFIAMSEFMQDSGTETVLTGIEVEVVIPEGASTIAIAEILKENQLINDTWIFRIKSRIDGYDGTFQQGTYLIDTGLTSEEIMVMLQTGVVYNGDVKFTIPEGYTTVQIAEKLEEEGICTAAEFVAAANEDVYEYDFLEGIPEREYRLEGYLFPNTYYVLEDATAYDVVEVMLDGFDAMYNEAYRELVAEGEYTLDEYVTMASIIEKEIAVADERATASGVIRNRLESGMMLQMDATVLYAMGIVKEDVTYTDLEVDSPYNTYKVTGLPLGPISNPGASSFEAALFPEDNDFIYYVVEARGQSNHLYFENYDDFLVAKNNYLNS